MAERALAFHAAPPPGHWINDPNGLAHLDGAYRLFAQHRADAPDFRETGWARFSSPDLLRWTFDGAAIPPDGADWAYSGSLLIEDGALSAIHTLHAGGMERQVQRLAAAAGASWGAAGELPSLGEPARNRRDPFIFRDREGWALLLAEPCDWTAWRDEPASRLRLYRSDDARAWAEAGTIGPWSPPGVMWEVPVLARIDGRDVLFVSVVDRRGDGASCGVRAWVGTLGPDGFAPDPDAAPEGQLVDLGPDYYALMGNVEEGWPEGERCFVAWAGSWATARAVRWPGFAGGPIALPRTLSIEERGGPRLLSRPAVLDDAFTTLSSTVPTAGMGAAAVPADAALTIALSSSAGTLRVEVDPAGLVEVERTGRHPFAAREAFAPVDGRTRTLRLFVDGPLVELFLLEDGVTVTAALETDAPFAVDLRADGTVVAMEWCAPA